MNKKEIKARIKELKNYTQEVWTDYELLQHDIRILSLEKMLLQQENKQLKEKMTKYLDILLELETLLEEGYSNEFILEQIEELEKGDSNE